MIGTNTWIIGIIIGYYMSNAIVFTDKKYAKDERTKDLLNSDYYICDNDDYTN